MLKIGDVAPQFALLDQDSKAVTLSDFLGKKSVVLFFYPKDFTPGCTTESCAFRDNSDDFSKYNAQILGVSKDDSSSHQKFIEKHQLPYPLLTDERGELAIAFGVPKTLGIFAGRATFVIDTDGVIQMAFSSQLKPNEHIERALSVAKKLFERT